MWPVKFYIIIIYFFVATQAHGYTPTLNKSGTSIRWWGRAYLPLLGNPKNKSGLSDSDVFRSVTRGFQRWKNAANGAISFDYWQGSDESLFASEAEYNGYSNLFFSSQGRSTIASNILGLTQVWYSSDSGEILEADIILNDENFHFTTNPKDTTGYGSPSRNASGRDVFIENVLTHELGHAYGLSHSGVMQSTMLFMESPEQAHVGCDEQSGMVSLYSFRGGSIRGKIFSRDNHLPVFGAQVLAISAQRATVFASALTLQDGEFLIQALEPGEYFLSIEPFTAGPGALPGFYSGINPRICPGNNFFSRTFLTEKNNKGMTSLKSIQVYSNQETTIPELEVTCQEGAGAMIQENRASQTLRTAPLLYSSLLSNPTNGFSVLDSTDSGGGNLFYRLEAISGNLEVHVMGYSLYSPIRAKISLLDSGGQVIKALNFDTVYEGESGFKNYDSALIAHELSFGTYFLKIIASPLPAILYPAGSLSIDSKSFLVVMGTVAAEWNRAHPVEGWDVRCKMDENFPSYQSPQEPPSKHRSSSGREQSVGFCGAISKTQFDLDSFSSTENLLGWIISIGSWIPFFILFRKRKPGIAVATPRS